MMPQNNKMVENEYIKRITQIVVIFVSVVAPLIINELYKMRSGYLTLWEAKETLQYVGVIIGVFGTLTFGIVTLYMNVRMQIVNEKLLKVTEKNLLIEKRNEVPILEIVKRDNKDLPHTKLEKLHIEDNKYIRLRFFVRNPLNHCIRKAEITRAVLGLNSKDKNGCIELKTQLSHHENNANP